jgi:3-oxoacyl-[acyl-carrier protein] reductase
MQPKNVHMEEIKGRVALVTGAGKGIGRAVALALAKEGVHVGLMARTAKDLESVAEEVLMLGARASFAPADISNMEQVNKAVEKIKDDLGFISILINNAGSATFGKFLDLEPEQWIKQVEVNLFGTYYVTRKVLPEMIENRTGDIINIASSAGLRGSALTSAYSASKFGLNGLTESLMQEVRKDNIRVTALNPSTVVTDLAYKSNLINNNEDKLMHPEDMAEFIVNGLKLNRRIFIKDAGIWSTNP